MAYQLEKALSSAFRSHPTSDPLSSTFGLPRGNICPGTPKTIKELKNTSFSELGYLFHKYPRRSLQKPKSVCLPEVARRTRAKMGSFTLIAAYEQPRVGMTDDLVNLFCHFIGNRMMSHFWTCDVERKNY